MKKIICLLLFIVTSINLSAQSTVTISSICGENVVATNSVFPSASNITSNYYTSGNFFDNVYDSYGNSYGYKDLVIDFGTGIGNKPVSITTTCQAGYFKVYFANGSGMESVSNATHVARRAVICQVLNDLSGFVNKSFAITTTSVFVNILVDDVFNFTAPNSPSVSPFLGLATSYYVYPANPTATNAGIVDNQIYKTIISQKDAYDNVVSPLQSTGGNGFYHGVMAFNFANPNYVWNLNSTICPSGQFDLYAIALHEITHALGFASLINGNGNSKMGLPNNYYSRFDQFLKDKNNNALITAPTNSCSNQYSLAFSSNTVFLGGANCNSNPQNFSNCTNANKYVRG